MPIPLSKPPTQSTKKIRHMLFQFLIGMLGAAVFLCLFSHLLNQTRQIATVDVTSMINRFVKTTANAQLPPDQLQKQVNAFGQALDNTLKTVAHDQHLVLLPKEAVITGAKDVSGEVEAIVNAKFTALNGMSHQS